MPWALKQYQTSRGDKPVDAYIEQLPTEEQARVYAALMFLAEKGNMLREPYSKSLGSGLFELRVRTHRMFYAFMPDKSIVLLHAYSKRTQKTPAREMVVALQRMQAVRGGA